MKKADIVASVAKSSAHKPEVVNMLVDEFIKQTIKRVAAGTPLAISQFGTFEAITEPNRESGSIKTGGRRLPAFFAESELDAKAASVDEGLVQTIAANGQINLEETAQILNGIFTTIKTALLQGDRVTLEGFGTFEVMTRGARTLIDPDTGETFTLPERKTVRFRSGKDLSVAVSDGAPVSN